MAHPIIITGMHRSGTSMLARVLESAGVFMGRVVESNHESVFFASLSDELIRGLGGRWDRPRAALDHLSSGAWAGREETIEYMRSRLKSLARFRYGWHSIESMVEGSRPWGWKDPRVSITWDLWRALFPDASYLVVDRHGVDVALSLQARSRKRAAAGRTAYPRKKPLYRLVAKRGDLMPEVHTLDPNWGMQLWGCYMSGLARLEEAVPARVHRVRYEELLRLPGELVRKIASALELRIDPGALDAATRDIDPGRAFAHRESEEGRALAARHEVLLGEFGYD